MNGNEYVMGNMEYVHNHEVSPKSKLEVQFKSPISQKKTEPAVDGVMGWGRVWGKANKK